MDIYKFREALKEQFSNLGDNLGYIVYCYDRGEEGLGTGFHRNADQGDAQIAIMRIAEQFGIDLQTLAELSRRTQC